MRYKPFRKYPGEQVAQDAGLKYNSNFHGYQRHDLIKIKMILVVILLMVIIVEIYGDVNGDDDKNEESNSDGVGAGVGHFT